MRRDYIDFQDRSVPLAFLITFRCYGTWLHGHQRGSVGRTGSNIHGQPKITPNETLRRIDANNSHPAFLLGPRERSVVKSAIEEVCAVRQYTLYGLHVRTNHVHVVTGNAAKVERMMETFKAYSTRALRSAGLIEPASKPWARHGSTRYLWTEEHIVKAVDYVLNRQGEELPTFD